MDKKLVCKEDNGKEFIVEMIDDRFISSRDGGNQRFSFKAKEYTTGGGVFAYTMDVENHAHNKAEVKLIVVPATSGNRFENADVFIYDKDGHVLATQKLRACELDGSTEEAYKAAKDTFVKHGCEKAAIEDFDIVKKSRTLNK